MGRRKSWLVPVQFLCGGLMVAGAGSIDAWVEGGAATADGSTPAPPDTKSLTLYFFALYFLMATQDVRKHRLTGSGVSACVLWPIASVSRWLIVSRVVL
jgi:hypothetical protein